MFSPRPSGRGVFCLGTFDSHTTICYTKDKLGRHSESRILDSNQASLLSKRVGYLKYGDHTTDTVSEVTYQMAGGKADRETYSYDADGRVCAIRENGRLKVKYTYDALGRLVREDNRELALTKTFEYDCGGNLLRQNEYPYSLADADALTGGVEVSYTYGDGENPDLLTAFDGQTIVYNAGGCPTSYLGHACTYTQGTLLASYDGHTFSYDADGLRVQKDGISYFYTDGVLRSQTEGDQTMVFSYGTQGMTGFSYGDATYFYRRNLFGDVTHIYTTEGVLCAKYLYDAWGNHTVVDAAGVEILDSDHIGNVNPIRYRGYYYDTETGLYYLQARYYDPKTGRFLSQDHVSYLDPEHLTGLNLFAYCNNDPVMYADPSGNFAISLTMLGLIVGAAIGATAGGIISYCVAKKHGATDWNLLGWTVLGILGGGIIGGGIGAGVGALITKATGVVGFSITKHSVVPVKRITVLGHDPGYMTLAKNVKAGFYRIPDNLYDDLASRGLEWTNNMKYLKDANSLGSQFVLSPDFVVLQKGTLWKEIQYLVSNGISWIML